MNHQISGQDYDGGQLQISLAKSRGGKGLVGEPYQAVAAAGELSLERGHFVCITEVSSKVDASLTQVDTTFTVKHYTDKATDPRLFGIVYDPMDDDQDATGTICVDGVCLALCVREEHNPSVTMLGGLALEDTEVLTLKEVGGAFSILGEEDVDDLTQEHWCVVRFGDDTAPPVYEATANASGGEITAKRLDSAGNLVGDELTFKVLPE